MHRAGLKRQGLSPLARGKHQACEIVEGRSGPIPAGAGETQLFKDAPAPRGAYPRWRGGNNGLKGLRCQVLGLSPLARGKHSAPASGPLLNGPIPAGAGETQDDVRTGDRVGAYPRWRGGNAGATQAQVRAEGLSPLARGKPGMP